MLLFKRLLTSCVLFLLLSLALLTVVGLVVGARGGVDYDSSYTAGYAFGYEVTREIRPGRFPEHAEHISSGCTDILIQCVSLMVLITISFFDVIVGLT